MTYDDEPGKNCIYFFYIYIYIISFPYLLTSCPVPHPNRGNRAHYLPVPPQVFRTHGCSSHPSRRAAGWKWYQRSPWWKPPRREGRLFWRKDPSAARFGEEATSWFSSDTIWQKKILPNYDSGWPEKHLAGWYSPTKLTRRCWSLKFVEGVHGCFVGWWMGVMMKRVMDFWKKKRSNWGSMASDPGHPGYNLSESSPPCHIDRIDPPVLGFVTEPLNL